MRSDFWSLPYAARQAIQRGEQAQNRVNSQGREIKELAHRVAQLEEALTPFADLSFEGTIWEGDQPDCAAILVNGQTGAQVTLGDFRRAREVVKK